MFKRHFVSIAFALCFVQTAFGATVIYTDRAGWAAASSSLQDITFDTALPGYTPPNSGGTYNIGTGLTVLGVTIQSIINGLPQTMEVHNNDSVWYNFNSGVVLAGASGGPTQENKWRITLPVGITSFGIDLMTGAVGAFSVRVNGTTIPETVPVQAIPSRSFFGITTDSDINLIEFIAPYNSTPKLDNISFGVVGAAQIPTQPTSDASEVPEASTWLLCATALLFISRKRLLTSTKPLP